MTPSPDEQARAAGERAPVLGRRMAFVIVGLNLALALYSALVPEYVRSSSTSIVGNMFLVLGWVALVVLASFLEAVAVRRLVSRGGWRGRLDIREERSEQVRPWRDWNLPLTIALAVLLGLNMLVFDQISRGFFVAEQRTTDALTRMRAEDGEVRREGIRMAARLSHPHVRSGLAAIVRGRGEDRALAAWALGRAGPPADAEALVRLLATGEADERAAAAIALGRLRHERLADEVAPLLSRPGEPVEAYLVGLGLLGDRHATLPVVELMLHDRTAPDHLAVSAWTLGRLGDERACPLLVQALGPEADPLSCAAAAAVGRIPCPGAAQGLTAAFDDSAAEARCEPRSSPDTDGTPIALWGGGNYRVVLLEALSSASREGARDWLARVARDPTQVPQVREVAARAAGI